MSVDSLYNFTCADAGLILRTTNAGANWYDNFSGTSNTLNCIYKSNDFLNFWLCVGNNGTILRSDFYSNWSVINSGVNVNLNSVSKSSYTYIAGDGGSILKSTNAGYNWIVQTSNTNANLHSILFINANTGWAVGDNGTIIHTSTDNYAITFNRLNAHTINSGFRNDGFFNL